jgi:hypothetical protein
MRKLMWPKSKLFFSNKHTHYEKRIKCKKYEKKTTFEDIGGICAQILIAKYDERKNTRGDWNKNKN